MPDPPSLPRFPFLPQVECRQTRTTAAAHELIRANLHRAPMYSGQIESAGPRYCPSIEDKVVRFPQRDSHGVFLEPESHRDDWIYCNGISTSLPADVQDQIVRSMPGCENAHVYRHGYAVEYDTVRPHQIHATGHTKLVEGLFLAGQINGTSGYEEAAAQGLIAGVNAALHALGRPEFVLGRDQAYAGVLMDDLVTKTPLEPYRMFTSRAEHRLLLRSDNTPDRLTPLAIELGLLSHTDAGARRRRLFESRRDALHQIRRAVDGARLEGEPLARAARRAGFTADDLRRALPGVAPAAPARVWETALADRKYEPFIARQHAEVRRHAEIEHRRLPQHIDYTRFDALRAETRHALSRFRPATFGQASRLEGVTPADITLLSILLEKHE
jgi:tRNA uridine 5-carboxymethylaminomethyl modification enzyme